MTAEILGGAACEPEAILKANMETRKGTMKTSGCLLGAFRGSILVWVRVSLTFVP